MLTWRAPDRVISANSTQIHEFFDKGRATNMTGWDGLVSGCLEVERESAPRRSLGSGTEYRRQGFDGY